MTFGRTGLKIAPYEAKYQTGTPKGRQTQGKNRIRSTKIRFRNFVIQQFCHFREFAKKTKLLNDKIAKTHLFERNRIFPCV